MKTYIFNGREFASKKETSLKDEVSKLKESNIVPHLALIIFNDNQINKIYTSLIIREIKKIGAELSILRLENPNKERVLQLINKLNTDKSINGIALMMPLPDNFPDADSQEIVNKLGPKKDIDGLGEKSIFIRPTSKAVLDIIESEVKKGEDRVVVVGATGSVGHSLVVELKKRNFQVTECNTKTANLKTETLKADILVSATGHPRLVSGEMIKNGAVVIDLGSPPGDVDFDTARKKASFITPVPGGVGPVTIACLMENLIKSAKNAENLTQMVQ